MDKLQEIRRKREMVAAGYDKSIKLTDIDWLIKEVKRLRVVEQSYEAYKSAQ